MEKKLYQLCICKQLGEFDQDTFWRSRLYSSRESSQNGYAHSELFDIADELCFLEVDHTMQKKYGNVIDFVVENFHNKGHSIVIQFVERVKNWILGEEAKNYYDYIEPRPMAEYDPVFWEILTFEVAEE